MYTLLVWTDKKHWFTLVELIVVITILAILGTLAFVSFQGYSQKAQWSKVLSDLRSISSVIETELTRWESNIHDFIRIANSDNIVTAANDQSWTFMNGLSLSGATYNVGMIDFIELWQDGTAFYNSAWEDTYRIGTISQVIDWDYYKYYQIAGLKWNSDTYVSIVKWNYLYDNSDITGLISTVSWDTGLEDNTPVDSLGI